jgi:hypothetical protein
LLLTMVLESMLLMESNSKTFLILMRKRKNTLPTNVNRKNSQQRVFEKIRCTLAMLLPSGIRCLQIAWSLQFFTLDG